MSVILATFDAFLFIDSTVNSYTFGYPRQLMNPYLEVLESTPECYESSIPVNAFQLVDTIPGLCISTRFKHLM